MKNVLWPMVVGPVLTGLALMVLGLILFARAPSPVQANDSTVGLVAVDMNSAGNGGDTNGGVIGTVEECISLPAPVEGEPAPTAQIDVIVDEVPADRGMSGFGFKLAFDPSIVHVTAISDVPASPLGNVSLIALDPDSMAFNAGNTTSTSGLFDAGYADFGAAGIDTPPFTFDGKSSETGPGVLLRLTLTAQATGISGLNLSSVGIGGDDLEQITIDALQDAKVAVGEPCPTVNTAPVAQDIKISVPLGSVGDWWPEVSDPQGDAVTCSLVGGTPSNDSVTGTSAKGGVVAVTKDCLTGSYTPPADLTGIDTFQYFANDGEFDSNSATVTVVVGPDTDGDGIVDSLDECPDTPEEEGTDDPNTPQVEGPDDNGCSASQVDLDADGICDPDAPSQGPKVWTIAVLFEDLDDSATDVYVTETTPFSVGDLILVHDEIMEITSITRTETGGTLTVVRGVSGTTAAAHGIGIRIFSPPSSCTGSDNCPDVINPEQKDSDGDGVGDLCETLAPTATPTVTPTVAAAAEPEATPPSEVPGTGFGPLSGGTDWTAIVLTVAGLVLVLGGLASPFAYRAIRHRNS